MSTVSQPGAGPTITPPLCQDYRARVSLSCLGVSALKFTASTTTLIRSQHAATIGFVFIIRPAASVDVAKKNTKGPTLRNLYATVAKATYCLTPM